MATSHAKEDEGPVEDIQNARQLVSIIVETYRNARDAVSLTADIGALRAMDGVVRDLEQADKLLVKAVVKLKKQGAK